VHERGLVAERRVPGAVDEQRLDRAGELALDRLDLRERAVLIGGALDDERRRRDLRQVGLEVPRAEARGEPRAVPAPQNAPSTSSWYVARRARRSPCS
jgi:hypothetical protein